MLADLLHAAADGEIVMSGRDDQVGPCNATLFIHFVVVNQRASRRLDHPHSFQGIYSSGGSHVFFKNPRIRFTQTLAL